MRIQQLLAHHGVLSNPFAEEDAQTDAEISDDEFDAMVANGELKERSKKPTKKAPRKLKRESETKE